MNTSIAHIVLFLLCVVSRLVTGINYIEDPECLRFALSLYEYDLKSLQPSFPGYPVFCYLVRLINEIVKNNSIAFSILGGISTYLIIRYSLKLLRVPIQSVEGGITAFLLFFNPLLWLSANRFTPDIFGTAILLAALFYLILDHENQKIHLLGWFLVGLLAGVKFSYLVFLVIPCIYAIVKKKTFTYDLSALFSGLLISFLPILIITGLPNLEEIISAQNLTRYSNFGYLSGTPNQSLVVAFFKTIWTDVLGGYWSNRIFITVINSIGIVACLFFGMMVLLSFQHSRRKILVFALSFILYSGWILFFKDIHSSAIHFLPFVPILMITISYGIIYFLVNFNYMTVKVLVLIFLFANVVLAIHLSNEHKKPSAIAQVKQFLDSKENTELHVVSLPWANFYLKQQGVEASFYSIEDQKKISEINSGEIIVVGKPLKEIKRPRKNYSSFQHNPYVSRLWTAIEVYQY